MSEVVYVSVIMPVYNGASFLAESIQSVLAQTYTHWELIVVDDGSTDASGQIVKDFAAKDQRIQLITQQRKGQGAARNTGIAAAKYGWIAFIDADDVWLPAKMEEQVAFATDNKADVVFADVRVINETGNTIANTWNVKDAVYKDSHGLLAFLQNNKIPLVTAMVKKNALETVHGFEERNGLQYGEDYDLWLRLLQKGFVLAGSSKQLALYRKHSTQSTTDINAMLQVVERLRGLQLTEKKLAEQRDQSVRLWIRRCIKTEKHDKVRLQLKKMIAFFPTAAERNFLNACNVIFPQSLVSKIILGISRSATKSYSLE